MLAVYAENYDKYKSYAYKICKSHELKNDLVNEMYVKLGAILEKNPEKFISDRFIYLMIKSIFFNQVTRNREIPMEIPPQEHEIENDVLEERIMMDEVLSEMKFFDREILLKTHEKSLRKIAKEVGCPFQVVDSLKQSALTKLKIKCQEKGIIAKL